MKVLVCGGRDYKNRLHFTRFMDELHAKYHFTKVIQGGARGADQFAFWWAKFRGLKCDTYKANWSEYGNSAGPIRNEKMLMQSKPDLVVAFPTEDSIGTYDMIARANREKVQVIRG